MKLFTSMFVLSLATIGGVAVPREADAVPTFARRHTFQCSVCHSAVPKLNAVGRQYKENGLRLSDEDQIQGPWDWKDYFPVAVQGDLHLNSNENFKTNEISVDAVQIFFGGPIAPKTSMYIHHHLIMANEPGPLHEAHVRIDRPLDLPLMLHAGQFESWLANSPGKTLLTHGFLPYSFKMGANPSTVGQAKRGAGAIFFLGDNLRWVFDFYKPKEYASGFSRFFFRDADFEAGIFGTYGKAGFTIRPEGMDDDSMDVKIDDIFRRYGFDFTTPVLGPKLETYGALYYARHSDPSGTGERGSAYAGFLEADFEPSLSNVFGVRYEIIRFIDVPPEVGGIPPVTDVGGGHAGHASPRLHTELEEPAEGEKLLDWGIFAWHYYYALNVHTALEYRWNIQASAKSQFVAGVHFAF